MIAAIDAHMNRAVMEALPFYSKHCGLRISMHFLLTEDRADDYPEGRDMLAYEKYLEGKREGRWK